MKRKNSKYLLIVSLLFVAFVANATGNEKLLSKDEFLSIVRTYHPVLKIAGIGVDKADALILQSRGAFDPNIKTGLDRKTFDGKFYYSYFNPQIIIPTWYGVDIKAGLEEVMGDRVTTESSFGQNSYVGVSVSANSLLFDARRATLRQAQLFEQQAEAERLLTINNILYDALSAYWNWVREYKTFLIVSNAITVNEDRMRFVRIAFTQGLRPAIDTTETLSQLQAFYVQQYAALLAYNNAGIELSNYLWTEENTPVSWNETIIPDSSEISKVNELPPLNSILSSVYKHPKLTALGYKIGSLEIEQKLKEQYFIPKLSVSANMLGKGYSAKKYSLEQSYLENNHKLGVSFSMPLFFRDAIGGLRVSKLKISETKLEQNNQVLQIENKVKSYYNEVLSLQKQLEVFTSLRDNYTKLYNGEQFRFKNGESSLFLVNSRENKLLEVSRKLVEIQTKLHKSYAGLIWSAGQLY